MTQRGHSNSLGKKRSPTGRTGGGSSDAAMTLIGLSHLWETGASIEELAGIGREPGRHVPFFSTEARPHAGGTGTEIFLQ